MSAGDIKNSYDHIRKESPQRFSLASINSMSQPLQTGSFTNTLTSRENLTPEIDSTNARIFPLKLSENSTSPKNDNDIFSETTSTKLSSEVGSVKIKQHISLSEETRANQLDTNSNRMLKTADPFASSTNQESINKIQGKRIHDPLSFPDEYFGPLPDLPDKSNEKPKNEKPTKIKIIKRNSSRGLSNKSRKTHEEVFDSALQQIQTNPSLNAANMKESQFASMENSQMQKNLQSASQTAQQNSLKDRDNIHRRSSDQDSLFSLSSFSSLTSTSPALSNSSSLDELVNEFLKMENDKKKKRKKKGAGKNSGTETTPSSKLISEYEQEIDTLVNLVLSLLKERTEMKEKENKRRQRKELKMKMLAELAMDLGDTDVIEKKKKKKKKKKKITNSNETGTKEGEFQNTCEVQQKPASKLKGAEQESDNEKEKEKEKKKDKGKEKSHKKSEKEDKSEDAEKEDQNLKENIVHKQNSKESKRTSVERKLSNENTAGDKSSPSNLSNLRLPPLPLPPTGQAEASNQIGEFLQISQQAKNEKNGSLTNPPPISPSFYMTGSSSYEKETAQDDQSDLSAKKGRNTRVADYSDSADGKAMEDSENATPKTVNPKSFSIQPQSTLDGAQMPGTYKYPFMYPPSQVPYFQVAGVNSFQTYFPSNPAPMFVPGRLAQPQLQTVSNSGINEYALTQQPSSMKQLAGQKADNERVFQPLVSKQSSSKGKLVVSSDANAPLLAQRPALKVSMLPSNDSDTESDSSQSSLADETRQLQKASTAESTVATSSGNMDGSREDSRHISESTTNDSNKRSVNTTNKDSSSKKNKGSAAKARMLSEKLRKVSELMTSEKANDEKNGRSSIHSTPYASASPDTIHPSNTSAFMEVKSDELSVTQKNVQQELQKKMQEKMQEKMLKQITSKVAEIILDTQRKPQFSPVSVSQKLREETRSGAGRKSRRGEYNSKSSTGSNSRIKNEFKGAKGMLMYRQDLFEADTDSMSRRGQLTGHFPFGKENETSTFFPVFDADSDDLPDRYGKFGMSSPPLFSFQAPDSNKFSINGLPRGFQKSLSILSEEDSDKETKTSPSKVSIGSMNLSSNASVFVPRYKLPLISNALPQNDGAGKAINLSNAPRLDELADTGRYFDNEDISSSNPTTQPNKDSNDSSFSSSPLSPVDQKGVQSAFSFTNTKASLPHSSSEKSLFQSPPHINPSSLSSSIFTKNSVLDQNAIEEKEHSTNVSLFSLSLPKVTSPKASASTTTTTTNELSPSLMPNSFDTSGLSPTTESPSLFSSASSDPSEHETSSLFDNTPQNKSTLHQQQTMAADRIANSGSFQMQQASPHYPSDDFLRSILDRENALSCSSEENSVGFGSYSSFLFDDIENGEISGLGKILNSFPFTEDEALLGSSTEGLSSSLAAVPFTSLSHTQLASNDLCFTENSINSEANESSLKQQDSHEVSEQFSLPDVFVVCEHCDATDHPSYLCEKADNLPHSLLSDETKDKGSDAPLQKEEGEAQKLLNNEIGIVVDESSCETESTENTDNIESTGNDGKIGNAGRNETTGNTGLDKSDKSDESNGNDGIDGNSESVDVSFGDIDDHFTELNGSISEEKNPAESDDI
ncbi:uncharacterized protein MONOS_4354 [Monocercomonoides exilis]|uniref:uncharacterized protein n=1 Tax=Monocercomonoides exilis TaxID=2049356 RepID=UPI00355A0ACE|nr:hypothetical protein MONOS_4354 [Monocercomonoides exilis]|eukprot:MONOS_4354.1-p1 / transcript=MONOS_4354.1 / gene=MONOS_4354 / organism=Monocercomonoides_exilis_PA203 / gene_product=unspecified product / transcript_product=unspecified product / location=Mono_scaffold00114:111990-116795(-) / protein_length=1602 / sequence_SO=supercontig / SO=protein_coding / is_pseudo=false